MGKPMYEVKIDAFEGPLDLLLYFIRRDEVDIYDISVAEIAQQYIEYIDMMQMLDLDVAGEFLVMAATLLQMKSEAMLPSGVAVDYEEPMMTREELVRQLLEYKKFKDAASVLSKKQEDQQNLYARSFVEPGLHNFDMKEFRINATLFDLLSAFRTVLQGVPDEQLTGLREEAFTVQQKIEEIMGGFKENKRLEFSSLFSSVSSRLEIIVTFLAILELIKMGRIIARQAQLFSKLWLYERTAKD